MAALRRKYAKYNLSKKQESWNPPYNKDFSFH